MPDLNTCLLSPVTPLSFFPCASVLPLARYGSDTLVKDPFFEHMPRHFGMTLEELYKAKHPTAWVEFERGELTEAAFAEKFWADGGEMDVEVRKGWGGICPHRPAHGGSFSQQHRQPFFFETCNNNDANRAIITTTKAQSTSTQ